MKYELFLSACALAVAWTAAAAGKSDRAGLLEKVASGEIKEARASWWGWNGADDTEALQAAIDSGVPKLIVDRMAGAWTVRPLLGRSNQILVFEKGVEVLAKKGEFKGIHDSMFSFRGATNVTMSGYGAVLRMRRMDYHKPPYRKAEWRHVLNFLSCSDVKVEGLVVAESGGDGIYIGNLGAGAPPCRNVTIRDCVCDRNYRQGISVISADGLLIENTVMKDTWGTPPAAGIDLEPNRPSEMLRRCVVRNCVSSGNQGNGYEVYLGPLVASSAPVDIVFDNCRSSGNGRAGFLYANNRKREENFPTGGIMFKNCSFEREGEAGISIVNKPAGSVRIGFLNCLIDGCCVKSPESADVRFLPPRLSACDNIRFRNLKIRQSVRREWISGMESSWIGKAADDVHGNVTVSDPSGGVREILLDDEWLREVQGARPEGIDLRHVAFSPEGQEVVDPAPGEMRDLQPVRARYTADYILYAETARRVNLGCRIWNYGGKDVAKSAEVRDMAGRHVANVKTPVAKQWGDVVFDVPAAGFYRLSFDLENGHGCEIRCADVPLALEGGELGQAVISTPSDLYVYAEGGRPLALQATGSGRDEPVRVTFSDPKGKIKLDKDPLYAWTGYAETEPVQGLWKVEVGKAGHGRFEDYRVDVLAQPCVFFLSKDRYWRRSGR